MVKLAKGAKAQGKPKKAPPPKEVEESDEEMEESEEEVIPVKTPSKKANTPAKATPGKKVATPAKTAVTPGKKGATPAGAKNGKKAKKEESEDEEEFDEESEEEKPVAKKPAAKKPVAKKDESEDEEDDDDDEEEEDDDEESEEENSAAIAKKTPAKKPSKNESEDEEDEEPMEVAPPVAKGKKAAAPKKEESEEEEDDDDEDEDDDEDDDDEEESVEESGKRKKEMPKNKAAPEKKKQRTEGSEGMSVFVANLNSAMDFDELKDALRDFFTKKNLPVQDVRIGSARKFGYVEFSSLEDVEKAIKLTGKKVLGFEIKIEKANSPAEKSKNAENKKERDARTLFVKNLPYSTSVEHLQEIFDTAKDVRLLTGKDGCSKGIAYVEFNTEAEADQAIQDKQGTEIEGRSLFIDYTGEKSQNAGGRRSTGGSAGGDSKVLVINNLAYSATEDSLQEVFEKATSVRIPQNNQGRPKGFAFVEFSSVEEAKEALDTLNNTEIEGRSIRIEMSQGSGPQGGGRGAVQSKTLFVRGLSEDTTEETLKEAFDGSVNARIVTDRDTGASKGFGFVDFSTAEDAKAAKEAMEDGEIDGNKVTLDFAKPKGEGQRGGRGGFGGRGGGRGGFGGRGGGRGGFGGRGGGRGFGGRGGGRGGFGGRGGGGFRGGKKTKFDD